MNRKTFFKQLTLTSLLGLITKSFGTNNLGTIRGNKQWYIKKVYYPAEECGWQTSYHSKLGIKRTEEIEYFDNKDFAKKRYDAQCEWQIEEVRKDNKYYYKEYYPKGIIFGKEK